MIELTSDEREESPATVPLFSLDGKVYSVSTQVRPEIGLMYFDIARKQGLGIAESWLAEKVIGIEGYEALLAFPHKNHDKYDEIMEQLRAIVFGAVRPKEPSLRGIPRRSSSTPSSSGSATA